MHTSFMDTLYSIWSKKREMPFKFKLKKDALISSYDLDALFLAHLYELLSDVC